jgi:hypothetical protein
VYRIPRTSTLGTPPATKILIGNNDSWIRAKTRRSYEGRAQTGTATKLGGSDMA